MQTATVHGRVAQTASKPAETTMSCPRCGAANDRGAQNCAVCRINLAFARENPAAIERLRQESAGRAWLPGHTPGPVAIRPSASTGVPLLPPVLLLLFSFVFSFCLGEAVHEVGHFLAHRAYGVDVGIRLDPFGGSRILGASLAPQEILGITSAAGPLLNVVVALSLFALLWQMRRPALLPLLLWGPIALVQEGVTFSLGLLTPGGDADLIVRSGVPAFAVLGLGLLFLASGVAGVCTVLPLAGLPPSASFGARLGAVAGGMVSFMALRLLGSSLTSPGQVQENVLPLLFSLLLAAVVAGLYGPLYRNRIVSRIFKTEPLPVRRSAVGLSAALAIAVVVFQLAWGG